MLCETVTVIWCENNTNQNSKMYYYYYYYYCLLCKLCKIRFAWLWVTAVKTDLNKRLKRLRINANESKFIQTAPFSLVAEVNLLSLVKVIRISPMHAHPHSHMRTPLWVSVKHRKVQQFQLKMLNAGVGVFIATNSVLSLILAKRPNFQCFRR